MNLRNGEHGYGSVAKVLHWVTVLALVAQFTIGYVMEVDDSGHGRGRGRGRGGESGRGRGRGGDDDGIVELGLNLVTAHVALGLLIICLAVSRVLWRRTGLPPWAETLSPGERTFAHWVERALLTLLFVAPATGLLLVAGDNDLVAAHIASHVLLYAAIACHVGLVLKHQVVNRDRLLHRML